MAKRVEPVGPKDATIMLVGEAPGADEERKAKRRLVYVYEQME